jgi:hypothetical protein
MGLRRIETITNAVIGTQAKVYRDDEWREYRVKFFRDQAYLEGADYHTDDKSDAQFTARAFCGFGRTGNGDR